MKFVRNWFAAAALISATVFAGGASAQTAYTDQTAFLAAASGVTSYTFPNADGLQSAGSTYTLNGVTFSSLKGFEGNDGGYGATPYFDSNTKLLGVSTSNSALGLLLGSYQGAQTINYIFNGTTGSLDLGSNRAISFLGFTNAGGPINIAFNSNSELDVTGFKVGVAGAVPEPATWAMMLVGFGAMGFAMRSAKRRSDEKFDAKIKKITYGAIA